MSRCSPSLSVRSGLFAAVACLSAAVLPGTALEAQVRPSQEEIDGRPADYSPYVDVSARQGGFAENLLWGDTHLHTRFSMDAGMFGTVLGPEEAYRFARGETVTSNTGQRVRAVRPLDFLVVADHAENLGVPLLLAEGNAELLATEYGRRFYDLIQEGNGYQADAREIGSDGRATEPVGNTVDESAATWTNTIGDPELRAVWTDPDFDPALPAVYYARVLEIPTPTWQAYGELRFGITMTPEGIPRSHQERAYTSPIWYAPR